MEEGRPPSKIQGYTVGARRDDVNTPDRIYVLLVASGAAEPTTHYAEINPSGKDVTGTRAGDDDSPLKWDDVNSAWYLQVDGNATPFTTLQANSLSKSWPHLQLHPKSTRRKKLVDRSIVTATFLTRTHFLSPAPITGFVATQISETNSPAYKTYYIHVRNYLDFERGVQLIPTI